MTSVRRIWAPLLGSAGIAVAVGHATGLHAASADPGVVLRETLVAGETGGAFVAAIAVLSLLWWGAGVMAPRVGIASRRARKAMLPALAGPGTAVAAALLDAVAFRCTAPALLGLGVGLGLLATWSGLAARPALVPAADGAAEGAEETVRLATPQRWSRRAAVGLVGFLAVGLPLVLIPAWSAPGGDEPHYLVVAHSLLEDGDLDVRDDYADRVYRPFHPDALSPHYRPGYREGSRYSMHGVGLPLLLLPAYAAARALETGQVVFPRLFLVLLFGAFALAVYGLLEDVAGRRVALAGSLATVLLAPLVFSPLYLFPEVPAMLLACSAYRGLRSSTGASDRRHTLAAVGGVAALPWLGVKYLPLAAVLVVGGWLCASGDRRRGGAGGAVTAATGALVLTLVAHGVWTWMLYRSASPMSVYLGSPGVDTGAPALGGDALAYLQAWPAALATAVGYVADQKEGLLMYGPHFLLAAAGLPWLWRRRRRDLAFLGLLGAAYIAPYALSQQLGGQGPPVRPLMAVLWIAALPLGLALTLPAGRTLRLARGGLLALAASLTALLAFNPRLLPHDYPVEASRLVRVLSPWGSDWWRAFPQWVNVETPSPATTAMTTGFVLLLAGWLFWLGRRGVAASRPRRPEELDGAGRAATAGPATTLAAALVVVLCSGGVLAHRAAVAVTDLHRPTLLAVGLTAWVEEQFPERLWAEPEGVWVRPGHSPELVLTSPQPVERVTLRLGSLVDTRASVEIGDDRLAGTARPGFPAVGILEPGPGWPWRDARAWRVRLQAERGMAPAVVGSSRDERLLGAFLQIDAVVPTTGGRGVGVTRRRGASDGKDGGTPR